MDNLSASCPCKRTRCPRHGDCAACFEHHKHEKKNPVYCQRLTGDEKRLLRKQERSGEAK